jgi:hypothetical protein
MRSSRLVLVVIGLGLGLGALASPAAAAQRVELAGKVTASRTVLAQRRVGEARYIAISDLFYRDRAAVVEVLDLTTRSVIQVAAKRAVFERRFGVSRGGSVAVPQGDVVVYRDGVVGLALASAPVISPRRYWYAELDARTGKLLRVADLAVLRDGEQLEVIGADADGGAAWFAVTRIGPRGRALVLRRLDLGSLEQQDEQRVELAARAEAQGHEHAVRVHAAADFSRFAIVEYAEDGVGMAPAHIYVADPVAGTAFAVAAPPAAYGVAFSPDGRYIYVGSAQRGTIARIDVAAGRIDKQVSGPGDLAERQEAVRAGVVEQLRGVRPAGPPGAQRREPSGRTGGGDGGAARQRHRLARRRLLRRSRGRGSAQAARRRSRLPDRPPGRVTATSSGARPPGAPGAAGCGRSCRAGGRAAGRPDRHRR